MEKTATFAFAVTSRKNILHSTQKHALTHKFVLIPPLGLLFYLHTSKIHHSKGRSQDELTFYS